MCCRWVLCANHTEPVKGFLGRFLRRKLIETEISSRTRNPELVKIVEWIPRLWHHLNCFLEAHSSSDVTIGERDDHDTVLLRRIFAYWSLSACAYVCVFCCRSASVPVMSHGHGRVTDLVYGSVELQHHPIHAGGCQRGFAGKSLQDPILFFKKGFFDINTSEITTT